MPSEQSAKLNSVGWLELPRDPVEVLRVFQSLSYSECLSLLGGVKDSLDHSPAAPPLTVRGHAAGGRNTRGELRFLGGRRYHSARFIAEPP